MVRVVWVRAPMPRHLVAMAHSTTYGTLRRGGVQSMVEGVVVVRRRVLLVVVGRGGAQPEPLPDSRGGASGGGGAQTELLPDSAEGSSNSGGMNNGGSSQSPASSGNGRGGVGHPDRMNHFHHFPQRPEANLLTSSYG